MMNDEDRSETHDDTNGFLNQSVDNVFVVRLVLKQLSFVSAS